MEKRPKIQHSIAGHSPFTLCCPPVVPLCCRAAKDPHGRREKEKKWMEGGITALRGDRRETLKERNTDIE
jgi:hypothetical protein